MENQKAKTALKRIVGISLILFPLILMVAFALHYTNLENFFVFELRYEPGTTRDFMNTLTSTFRARAYTIPHGVAYLSLPFLIVTALYLAYLLWNQKPWYAIIGASLSIIGAVFLSGVFAAWLSFAAVGNVSSGQVEGAIPALEALTEMQGPLMYITSFSALSLVGLMVLAVGLFSSQIMPRWSASLLFIGNLLILVFMDLDNWMFIGALLILLALTPLSLKLLTNQDSGKKQETPLDLVTA
jgi:hypothetical protein